MLKNFKKPHGILLLLIAAFILAWVVWTMVLVPRSDMPLHPSTPMNPTGKAVPPAR